MDNSSFKFFPKLHGLVFEYDAIDYSVKIHQVTGDTSYYLNPTSSYYIYQQSGFCYVDGKFLIEQFMYGSLKGGSYITNEKNSFSLLIEVPNTNLIFNIGGPIEKIGRLKYIDGCTDSLLISPIKYGDSCFNHLHFPERINQTMHTHPSIRIGIVTKGNGRCITPFGNIDLVEGMVFAILPQTLDNKTEIGTDEQPHLVGSHCFQTFDGTMDVIAFHPDSDFGAKDEEHPMINRTIVDGVSAKNIDTIRTK